MPLPIHAHADTIVDAVSRQGRVILTAPTGSGKSTQVPQILIDRLPSAGRVLVLQPRRLAARMLATRVAAERDQHPGGEVGYITRFEQAWDPQLSRIVFITEGVLLRLLQDDPELSTWGAIVFDEFHERALNADLGLGLASRLQAASRPDLRLVVMSATLQSRQLADYLETRAILEVPGRQFPVDIAYLAGDAREAIWDHAARGLRQLLAQQPEGDILIFMPGANEIRRTIDACGRLPSRDRLVFMPLYSNLAPAQQDAVMEPVAGRKIIVATNIAETSLTIDGVRHVIDSGLARINRYAPGHGFDSLLIEPISKFSADQRAGRAGRQGPGTCLRLWSQHQQQSKPLATDPEIQRVDLAEPILQLRAFGFDEVADFPWLDPPDHAAVQVATATLQRLGALDGDGRLTSRGRSFATFPAHPRLARLLQEASERRVLGDAAAIAALLTEAPIYATRKGGFKQLVDAAGGTERDGLASDFFPLLQALEFAHHVHFDRDRCDAAGIHANGARQVWRTRDYYLAVARRQGLRGTHGGTAEDLLKALLLSFPDHLARRRDQGTLVCELADGRRGELARESTLRQVDLILAGECREIGNTAKTAPLLITLASEVRREWLESLFPESWERGSEAVWDHRRQVVEQEETVRCLGLVFAQKRTQEVDAVAAAELLTDLVLRKQLHLKGWDDAVHHWIDRVRWLAQVFPDRGLIAYDDADIAIVIGEICAGERTYAAIRAKPCLPYVRNVLSWDDQHFVEKMAPERVELPCGRRMPIDYVPGQPPKGRAFIQDLYGMDQSPTIAGGSVPLLMEILAPNHRPVQVTDDLAGFWKTLYPELRKQLSKRYPRHEWR